MDFGTVVSVIEARDEARRKYNGKWMANTPSSRKIFASEAEAVAWIKKEGIVPVKEENYWRMVIP